MDGYGGRCNGCRVVRGAYVVRRRLRREYYLIREDGSGRYGKGGRRDLDGSSERCINYGGLRKGMLANAAMLLTARRALDVLCKSSSHALCRRSDDASCGGRGRGLGSRRRRAAATRVVRADRGLLSGNFKGAYSSAGRSCRERAIASTLIHGAFARPGSGRATNYGGGNEDRRRVIPARDEHDAGYVLDLRVRRMYEYLRRGSAGYGRADVLARLAAAALTFALRFLRHKRYGARRLGRGKYEGMERSSRYGGEHVKRHASERRVRRERRSFLYLETRDYRLEKIGSKRCRREARAVSYGGRGNSRSPLSRVLGLPCILGNFCWLFR